MIEPFDYRESQDDANELIEEFGQIGAIRRTVLTPPANPWEEGTETITYYAVTMVVLPIDEKQVDGTLILTGDRQVLMGPDGLIIDPAVGDVLLFNGAFAGEVYTGEEWMIAQLKKLAPSGVTVMFNAIVRM